MDIQDVTLLLNILKYQLRNRLIRDRNAQQSLPQCHGCQACRHTRTTIGIMNLDALNVVRITIQMSASKTIIVLPNAPSASRTTLRISRSYQHSSQL